MSQSSDARQRKPNEPYCGNCDYTLTGLTESSKCPECGKPLVEVLQRAGAVIIGKRYRSPYVIFGLPLIDIAYGPHGAEKIGKARGIIALGDNALGWLAIGGFARGIFAFGGMAIGGLAFGGMSCGLIAFGGWALGLLAAVGGGAVGGLAFGGGACGYAASGGGAVGYYARGGGVWAQYAISPIRTDVEAVEFFTFVNNLLFIPPGTFNGPRGLVVVAILMLFWAMTIAALVGLPLALIVWREFRRRYPREVTATP